MKFTLALASLLITANAAQVLVTWDVPTDLSVTGHVVRYGLSSASKTNVVTVTGTNSVSITVPDNANLVLDVASVNAIGLKSIPSPEITFSTTPPSAPTNIRVIAQ